MSTMKIATAVTALLVGVAAAVASSELCRLAACCCGAACGCPTCAC